MSIIKSFEAKELKKRGFAIKVADSLTSSFGSISFFLINSIFFAVWILANTGKVPDVPIFDPFPFALLTSIVSLEAIFLSIIVLISQNRQNHVSTLREELDMQVNLIAEREITKILKVLKEVLRKTNMEFKDIELEEMIKETDVSYIERSLEKQMEGTPPKKK